MTFWNRIKAMWVMAPMVEAASRVVVLSDDTLVVEYPFRISHEALTNIREGFNGAGFPRVLILEEGMRLSAVLGRAVL